MPIRPAFADDTHRVLHGCALGLGRRSAFPNPDRNR